MAFQKIKKEPLHLLISKFALGFSFVASLIAISIVLVYLFAKDTGGGEVKKRPSVKSIVISEDGRSIIDFETGKTILAIEGAQSYLETSGFAYDPDTFQTTNAKYAGDCFTGAVLSNNKDKIVFSTGCLSGDLPQAWIGVDDISQSGTDRNNTFCKNNSTFNRPGFISEAHSCINFTVRFLTGGSGRNFVWSQDDKTITYEADLGLSGMTETRTIDSVKGEMLERKNSLSVNDLETKNWQDCKNEKYGYEVKYPLDWKVWLPGAPEARLASCNENLSLIAFSPNIYAYSDQQQINIDVYDQDRSKGTVWEGATSLSDYLNKKAVKIKKETTVDGERLIWVDKPDSQLITFNDGSIYNFSFNNIDDSTLDKFLNTFKFIDKDETADWKTYRNEKYGYYLTYPSVWNVEESAQITWIKDTNNKYLFKVSTLPNYDDVKLGDLKYIKEFVESLQNYLCEDKEGPCFEIEVAKKKAGGWILQKSSEEILDGASGMSYEYIKNSTSNSKLFYVIGQNEKFYEIELTSFDSKDISVPNQILSTFKFIEPEK